MKFIVVKREVWTSQHEVEANSEEEALQLVMHGKGNELDDCLEYSHDLDSEYWTTHTK